MDTKSLKKLADICRKAGITHFKGDGFEFTLGDLPEKKTQKSQLFESPTEQIESEGFEDLSEEDRLFWSSAVDRTES